MRYGGNGGEIEMKFKTKAERDKFIEDNIGLVEYAIKSKFLFYDFYNNELTREDVKQIALTGLIRAVDKYEENRGYSFSSYAMKWICGAVFNATKEVKGGIRFGRKVVLNKNEIGKYSSYMNDEEIAEKLGLTVDEVKKIKYVNYSQLSLNLSIKKSEDEDLEIMDCIKDLHTYIDYDEKFRIENIEKNLELSMRVRQIYKNVKIVVKSNDFVIHSVKKNHMAPGEMEKITLSKTVLGKIDAKKIVVEVVEEDK